MISKKRKWWSSSSSKTENAQELEQIQLIEGNFNAVEAADVLLSLVTYKIKFHNLQLLNNEEKNGISQEQSEKHIAELKEAKNRITQIIMDARNSGASIDINSTIDIKVVEPK